MLPRSLNWITENVLRRCYHYKISSFLENMEDWRENFLSSRIRCFVCNLCLFSV